MIVVDASALFEVLDRGGDGGAIEARLFDKPGPICVPHLIDAEVASVLRKHVLSGRIGIDRAHAALADFLDLALTRFPHIPLLPRAFALRDRMTAYDALYIALAESLRAPFITRDRRLANAAAGLVSVETY